MHFLLLLIAIAVIFGPQAAKGFLKFIFYSIAALLVFGIVIVVGGHHP
jgi:hypothetical protein